MCIINNDYLHVGHKLSGLCCIFAAKTYIYVKIMVKNWIVLKDEASEVNERFLGLVIFSSDELKDWLNVTLRRIEKAMYNNKTIRELISNSNVLILDGLFCKKSGVVKEQLGDLMDRISEICENIEYGRYRIQYDSHKGCDRLILGFYRIDACEMEDDTSLRLNYSNGNTTVAKAPSNTYIYSNSRNNAKKSFKLLRVYNS